MVGAIDWRLDGFLSGTTLPVGSAGEVLLWTMGLRAGAISAMYCQPLQSDAAFGKLVLGRRDGWPWLSFDLALALTARGAMTWPAHAVVCRREGGLYMAVANEHDADVKLQHFTRGERASWRIKRPSPGRLSQLFAFEGYAGLIDTPPPAKGSAPSSRLILCELGAPASVQCVQLGALCPRPGIVSAHVSARQCVLDLSLCEPGQRGAPGRLWRCSVDRRSGELSKRMLATCQVVDAVVQLDPRGRARRFAYLCGLEQSTACSVLCRLDLEGQTTLCRNIPFAQRARGLALLGVTRHEAGPGWLATIVHDHVTERSAILLSPLEGMAKHCHAVIRVPPGFCLSGALAWSTQLPMAMADLSPPHDEA